jgi:hypothetical protein
MAKIKKRKGYTPTPQNNWAIPTHPTTGYASANTSIGTTINTGTITFNPGTSSNTITISPNQYATSGYIYSFNGSTTNWEPSVTYEPLHPVAINDAKTGRRLIVWEPS